MADTAALVVALSAQLTKFEKDMRDAGIMADKATKDIEDKFSKINPQVSSSFLGNLFSNLATKGLDAAIKAVTDFANGFLDLKKAADLAEISLGKVYGISAALGGAATTNAQAIEKLTIMLDDMRRGEDTAFGALKDANPAFFQNMGKNTYDVAENMARVAEMVKQAGSEVEKWKIAEAAGFTRDMVKELEKGGEHFRKITAENEATGQKLAEAEAKAEALKTALFDAAQNALGLKTAMADFYKDSLMMLGGLLAGLQKFRELSSNTWGSGGKTGGLADPVIKDLETLQEKLNSAGKAATTFNERFSAIGKGTSTADPNKPLAHPALKSTGGGSSDTEQAYERETNAINKQIAVMQAQNATLGESAYAQEEYRVQLVLSEKAAQDGKELTAALNDEIAVTAERAATAKQALAEHTFAINRLNAASQTVGSALSTAFADAIVEGKSLNDVVGSLIKTLEKAAINATVMSLFSPGAGGTTSPFASLFKGFAGGTDFAPGGMAMVGEHGPELVNLPRGSQVIPNDVLRSGSGGGGAIVYSPAIDARGASVEAVARLAQIMEQDRATFASRTVATIQQARRGRVPGL